MGVCGGGERMTDILPAAGSCRVGLMSQRRINLPQQRARELTGYGDSRSLPPLYFAEPVSF